MGGRAAWLLAAILLVGLALRVWGLAFGLPNLHRVEAPLEGLP